MKYRSVLLAFTMLLFCSSLAFGAGSFFETANQADESGQAVKKHEPLPPEEEVLLEEDEAGKSGVDKDREKDSPADHDNGKGNDDKVAKDKDARDNSLTGTDRVKDSPADHDNGKGNDDKVAKDKETGADRVKDSPADHDNGKGNDDKAAKDKKVIDPANPPDNDEFDPSGKFNPGKMGGSSGQDLVKIIGGIWKINVTGWQSGHVGMHSGFGWSHSHLFEIYRSIYVLPRFFFSGGLNLHWGGCGFSCGSTCHLRGNSIFFCNHAPMRQGWLSALFLRESARWLFLSKEFAYLRAQWIKMFWLNERVIKIQPPFKYVCKTPDEDFGESVKSYWCCGDWFRSRDEARYEFVHRLVMKGRKFSWSNGGCGCDESDEAAGFSSKPAPKPPVVATSSAKIGGGDHGASGKADLNDKNKIDNANKANNTAKTTTVIKTPAPAVKPVVTTPAKPVVAAPAKPVVTTPAKPVVAAPAKPVVKTPAKPVVAAPAKPVATTPAKTVGGGDHGASGKADLNDKNKIDNASKANNTVKTTTVIKTPAPAVKPVVTTPAKPVVAAPAKPVVKTPAKPVVAAPAKPVATTPAKTIGGGDHGASGKADLNDKNKVDNASKANNGAKTTTAVIKTTAATAKTTVTATAKPATTATAKPAATTPSSSSSKTPASGNGDHGASGKADLNDKNKVDNAATANNTSAKTNGSNKK